MNGIIFIVDAADRTRFQEAKDELQGLLESQELAEVLTSWIKFATARICFLH